MGHEWKPIQIDMWSDEWSDTIIIIATKGASGDLTFSEERSSRPPSQNDGVQCGVCGTVIAIPREPSQGEMEELGISDCDTLSVDRVMSS